MTLLVLCSSLALAVSAPTASASVHATATKSGTARAGSSWPVAADSFVTHSGGRLLLEGNRWRFSGVDMYWLGLDDNVQDSAGPTYPSHGSIDDGFASAARLGARLVRAHTLGISVGAPRTLEPSLGVFNDAAFDSIDYAVASARRHGVRLMIPLTDEWHYYHGGKHTFTAWRGHPDLSGQNAATSTAQKATEALFYTDASVISDFHAYVAHLLDHVNPYTGLKLGRDATIAIWETGNELWDAPVAWTEQTAKFIKTHAPQALVADGSAATGMHVAQAAINAPDIDIVGGHFYPTDPGWAAADARTAAANGKAYVIGEYPAGGAGAAGWLAGLAANADVAGDLAWTLLPRLADGTPEPHGDGYVFHVPGATPGEMTTDALLAAHMQAMTGSAVVPSGPDNLLRSAGVATTSDGAAAFATGSTGATAPALSSGVALGSGPSLRVTMLAAGYAWVYPRAPTDGAAVSPGRTYSATVTVRLPSDRVSPAAGAAHLTWYDSSGRYLSGSDGAQAALTAGGWRTLSVTAVAPAGAAFALPQWQTPQPASVGDVVDLGQLGISAGATAQPWRAPGS